MKLFDHGGNEIGGRIGVVTLKRILDDPRTNNLRIAISNRWLRKAYAYPSNGGCT